MGAAVSPITASAQDKKDETSFDLVPNPQFVDCLRKSSYEEPKARATVIRGKLNDTLILDLDGFKAGLAFDLFTVQRSPFLSDKTPDPNFKNVFKSSFGLEDVLEVRIGRFIRQERAALYRKEIEGETGFESIKIQN